MRSFAPDGAYYVMTDITDLTTDDDVTFARRLIADPGVATVPGSSFYSRPELGGPSSASPSPSAPRRWPRPRAAFLAWRAPSRPERPVVELALIIPVAVVAARLIVPLFIPAYPLPAILVAMVLDGIDQTVFSLTLESDLAGYQTYDKALDIYYLDHRLRLDHRELGAAGPTFVVGRFLWYYRLVGVALFE